VKLFSGISRKIGEPPGALAAPSSGPVEPASLTLFHYNGETITEELATSGEKNLLRGGGDRVTWLNVDGIHDTETLRWIGKEFGLHDLVLEDIQTVEQRPKYEEHDRYVFVSLKMIYYNSASTDSLVAEQVSLIAGKGVVISFQERKGDVFDSVRQRLRKSRGRIRHMGADYLLYALMDGIVDSYFMVIERLGDQIEVIENSVLDRPGPEVSADIHALRRVLILLRRSIWPLREVLSSLLSPSFAAENEQYA